MKRTSLILIILMSLFINNLHAQCGETTLSSIKPTSVGIVIYSNDIETVWNAMRYANFSKSQGDTVSIFLLGKGVELDNLVKTEANLKEQSDSFLQSGGVILGCGTCLSSRKNNNPQVCKFSSLSDLYQMIHKNKIVMTF